VTLVAALAVFIGVFPITPADKKLEPPLRLVAFPRIVQASPDTWVRATIFVPRDKRNSGLYLQWWIGDSGEYGLSYWDLDGDSPAQYVKRIKHVSSRGLLIIRATLVRVIGGKFRGTKVEAVVEIH